MPGLIVYTFLKFIHSVLTKLYEAIGIIHILVTGKEVWEGGVACLDHISWKRLSRFRLRQSGTGIRVLNQHTLQYVTWSLL